jgi:hypothetical protein
VKQGVEVTLASSRGIDRLQAAKLASFLQSVAQISLCSHHRATFSFTAAVRRSAQVRGGELQRARSPYLMFAKPTVFIIGAGASAEYGLPLGSALKDRIASAVRYRYKDSGVLQDGDETLLIAIRRQFNSEKATVKSYIAAGLDLAASMPIHASIDEALHYWSAKPEAVQLGKLSIAHEILMAESNSSLSVNRQTGRAELPAGGWIFPFLSMTLGSDLTREQAEQAFANVTLINFNYDRTIEQYLYWSLQQYGRVSTEVAARAVGSLKQIRPYGSIGNLPWQENPGPTFGGSEAGDDLFSIAKSVRTYTEQQHEGTEQKIDQALESARRRGPTGKLFVGRVFTPRGNRSNRHVKNVRTPRAARWRS